MDSSHAVPASLARVTALIAARHNLPMPGVSPRKYELKASTRRAHRESLSDVHPANRAAGRPALQIMPYWHGNCILPLDADGADRIAIHGARRHCDARQQWRTNRNQEKVAK